MSFFFSSRRRHTRLVGDWSSDVCSSDLGTARELAEDLDRWERGEPVEAEPATFRYLVSKAVRRHRGRITAAAGVLLLALSAALYGVWRIEEARRAAELALF